MPARRAERLAGPRPLRLDRRVGREHQRGPRRGGAGSRSRAASCPSRAARPADQLHHESRNELVGERGDADPGHLLVHVVQHGVPERQERRGHGRDERLQEQVEHPLRIRQRRELDQRVEHRRPHDQRAHEDQRVHREVEDLRSDGQRHELWDVRDDEDEVEQHERDQRTCHLTRDRDPAAAEQDAPHPGRCSDHQQRRRDERQQHVLDHVDGVQARLREVVDRPVRGHPQRDEARDEHRYLPARHRPFDRVHLRRTHTADQRRVADAQYGDQQPDIGVRMPVGHVSPRASDPAWSSPRCRRRARGRCPRGRADGTACCRSAGA